jgi:hypothetical protein
MGPKNLEALGWINSENVSDFASNKFDYKNDAIEFVEKLYLKGAIEVLINSESIMDEDEELYADAIVVKLPEDLSKRNNVLHFCQTESQPGCYIDVKGDLVHLWWD